MIIWTSQTFPEPARLTSANYCAAASCQAQLTDLEVSESLAKGWVNSRGEPFCWACGSRWPGRSGLKDPRYGSRKRRK